MPLELMIALILVLPIIILFVVFVWYLNIRRTFAAVRENREDRPDTAERKRLENNRI
jgi:Tfp pilus assembly protein PilW